MFKKRWFPFLLLLASSLLACNFVTRLFTPGTPAPTLSVSTPITVTQTAATLPSPGAIKDIRPILKQLNGQPCAEQPAMTCVTIAVPLNHFDTANTETLQIVFAVLPATGERYGMYVQAFPGGPGGAGIASAYPDYFDKKVLEHFDIVYFDQRGVGLSSPLACPKAYAANFLESMDTVDKNGAEGLDTPAEQQQAVADARTFDEQCVAEIGIDPAKLTFYGTRQVAEDVETFRQTIGDLKFWLYGVSYGTDVAQTYAAAHADRLAGLILDGTVDLTLDGEESAFSQEKAFNDVLVATLKACDADSDCSAELGGNALSVYDNLAAQISKKPIHYDYPLPSGQKVARTFDFSQLEYTAAYQMYSLGSRSLFLRALAAAQKGDIVPMARLFFKQANLDPITGNYLGDPTFSDTMFIDVHCTDNSYYSGTPEERVAKVIQAGQASNGTVPRLDGAVYTGLTCAYWPSSPNTTVRAAPLQAPGVPTLVLNATLDPATPFQEGKSVFEHLTDGYHIYVEGGQHSIFGRGEACPDDYVTGFLVNGQLPAQKETVCKWDPAVIYPYVSLMPENVSSFNNPLQIFLAVTDELLRQPEYYYSDVKSTGSAACTYGGSFTFGPGDGSHVYAFDKCTFTRGFEMTGTGSYNLDAGNMRYDVQITGQKTGSLVFTYDWSNGNASVTGTYGGKQINITR